MNISIFRIEMKIFSIKKGRKFNIYTVINKRLGFRPGKIMQSTELH